VLLVDAQRETSDASRVVLRILEQVAERAGQQRGVTIYGSAL
jgi:hypothetical protein